MRSLIFFAASSTLLCFGPAAADEARYEAVWHSDDGASLTTAPLSLSAFLDTGAALVDNGMRLIDAETRMLNGQRVYAGLWTQGTGSNIFVGPIGPVEMREELEARREQGLRLHDFEIFRTSNGGRRYVGVWRPGSGTEILTGPMEFDAFVARGEDFINDGLRLIDVEVENIDGRVVYSGLFRTGTGSNFVTAPLPGTAFRVRRDEMVADGLELVDLERIEIGGSQRLVGVWASGDGESRLSRLRSFPDFFVLAQDQFNDGNRAVDFEIRVVQTDDDDDGGPGGGIPPSPVADLPPLPPYVELTGGDIFRIDWSHIIADMPRIEIPRDYLPDYLPEVNGQKVLPTGSVCGFVLVKADSAFWQVPGDTAFNQPPFNAVPNVEQQDPDSFLGGIDFWGPVLGCDGTQQEWTFDLPLTTQPPFNPQDVANLSLVIQMNPPTGGLNPPRIEFTPPFPSVDDLPSAHELWDDEWIEDLLEWAEALEQAGQLEGEYCTVSSLMVEICENNPGLCPVADAQGNC